MIRVKVTIYQKLSQFCTFSLPEMHITYIKRLLHFKMCAFFSSKYTWNQSHIGALKETCRQRCKASLFYDCSDGFYSNQKTE